MSTPGGYVIIGVNIGLYPIVLQDGRPYTRSTNNFLILSMISAARYCLILILGAAAFTPALPAAPQRVQIDLDHVVELAAARAAAPYQSPRVERSSFLNNLSYDDHQLIQFVTEKSLWRGDSLPFQVQFFHPGGLHRTPVSIHEYSPTYVQKIPFVRTYFNYHTLKVPGRLPASLEYAGFRLIYPLNEPEKFDEVIAFLGASYFRALARGQRYGVSARGIAINPGGPGDEEFPNFVEFWLGKPEPDAISVQFFGLLDGPSVTGAFQFDLTPGEETVVTITATLFFREAVANLGLAPLTSMFWFGENSASRFGDFRPEVHDSDGLLVASDGETRLWRPLNNPRLQRTIEVAAPALVGFGLFQRDRQYRNYEDTEARYEARPSVWIEPIGDWPPGRVRLLELPTRDEYMDNIVAYWSPEKPPVAGERMDFAWRQRWTSLPVFGGPPGFVRATRQTVQFEQPGRTKFVVDFDGAGLESVPASADVRTEVTVPEEVTVIAQYAIRNAVDASWRLVMVLDAPAITTAMPVRARLLLEGKPLTETWINDWTP